MERFVEIEYWDYMDAKPRTEVRTFLGDDEQNLKDNVERFVKHMQDSWCSGTTRLIGIFSRKEAIEWIEEQVAKEKRNWQEDSQEFIDNMFELYRRCYGKV